MDNTFFLDLKDDKISSCFCSFSSNILGIIKNINFFYTLVYKNNLPISINDPRNQQTSFEYLIKIYKKWIKPNDFCIDIGAFWGDTTLPMAFLSGNGKVLAFEPHPNNFKQLERNISCNPCLQNVELYNYALTEEEKEYTFMYNTDGNGNENGGLSDLTSQFSYLYNHPIKVQGIILNKLLKEKYSHLPLSFIKVDTEGKDCDILLSIKDTILLYKPVIHMEWAVGTSDQVNMLLKTINYKALDPHTLNPVIVSIGRQTQDLLLLPI